MSTIGPDELRPQPGATHAKKRVGRGNGSGHGTYSGRGLKGQKARSGKKAAYDAFEGGQFPTSRKYHVLRGFNNRWKVEYQPVNLEVLAALEDGTTVTPESLRAAGVLKHGRQPVKILGEGDFAKRLTVSAHAFSASAKEKIEQAGGTATVLEFERSRKLR